MTFITLERPDYYKDVPFKKGYVERRLVKQKPVTINPQYIVSMIECFDNSKKFDHTELYLSNGTHYDVTSRIEKIVEIIEKEQMISEIPHYKVFKNKDEIEEAYEYFMEKNFGNTLKEESDET